MWYDWILSNPAYVALFFIVSVAGLFLCTDDFHMLQQNSYFISRYSKWLWGNVNKYIARLIWACVILISCAVRLFDTNIVCLIVGIAYLAFAVFGTVKRQRKAIKPLVFTARVKRMYASAGFIYILFIAVASLIGNDYAFLPLLILAVITPLCVVLSDIINMPIEALFRKRFINDAKRILKSDKALKTIGITGSFGKTSTKFILARILQEKYNLTYTPASFNTPLGVVRTIRENLKSTDELFICEMGAKNIGDIKEICDIVFPDVGIISSVGAQHLETFKTVDNVAKTKFELADAVLKKGGKVYVNFDSQPAMEKASGYDNVISYGTGENCDVVASDISCGRDGVKFTINYNHHKFELTSRLLGVHNVLNIVGAVGMALDLGVEERDIKYAVAQLKPIEHRLEMKPFVNGALLVDDAYNANPNGSIEAVNVLASFTGMRRIIVTPGLVELGDQEYDFNKQLGAHAAKMLDDVVFVGNERSIPLADGAREAGIDESHIHVVATFKDAMSLLRQVTDSNTVVLFENDLPDNYAK